MLHLIVDGASHYVAGRQREPLVVFLHEFVAVAVFQYGTGTAHGFGDEEGRLLGGVVKAGGVKLHELQIFQHTACTMYHGYAVASRDDGCRRGGVYIAHAAGGQQGHLGQIGVYLVGLAVQGVGSEAVNVGCVFRYPLAQVVLGDDIDGELVFLELDVGVVVDGLQQSALYLGTSVVFVVQDTELGVPSLAVQVETAAAFFVEVDAIAHQLVYALGGFADGHLHHIAVADAVAGNQGVFDMFVETVGVVHHGGDAALCIFCRPFRGFSLGEDAYFAVGGHFEGKTQSCNAGTDNQKVYFVTHSCA